VSLPRIEGCTNFDFVPIVKVKYFCVEIKDLLICHAVSRTGILNEIITNLDYIISKIEETFLECVHAWEEAAY
jgi:hypothetical protein